MSGIKEKRDSVADQHRHGVSPVTPLQQRRAAWDYPGTLADERTAASLYLIEGAEAVARLILKSRSRDVEEIVAVLQREIAKLPAGEGAQ